MSYRYKLGTQVDPFDLDKFEFSLCFMDNKNGYEPIAYIPLGAHLPTDEVVKKARELINLLNENLDK